MRRILHGSDYHPSLRGDINGPDQGVGFPTAGLPVRKYRPVVALENILDGLLPNDIVHLLLSCIWLKHQIKRILRSVRLHQHLLIHRENAGLAANAGVDQLLLEVGERAEASKDFDVSCCRSRTPYILLNTNGRRLP